MSKRDEPPDQPQRPRHVPVMLAEVLEFLAPQPGQRVVDATLGAAGHSVEISKELGPSGLLIGIDRDPTMLALAQARAMGLRAEFAVSNFAELRGVLDRMGVGRVDSVLMDLGIASDQLDDPERGFSFSQPGPLDMRIDRAIGEPAYRLVNRLRVTTLAEIFWRYGQERYSRRVARAIDEARRHRPIRTTEELASIVRRAMPPRRPRGRIDPATRVFQALRIAVNDELGSLARGLSSLPDCIRPGGRVVVISFHSLEDRLVKNTLRQRSVWEPLVPKPLRPQLEEVAENPRARSARLRAGRLIAQH